MTYLIDSDVLADYLQGIPQAVDLLTRLPDQGLAISLITFGEIYEGIYFGRDPKRSEQVFRQVLRGVTVLPLNQAIMNRFARIRGELRQRGQIIGDPDILIAAGGSQPAQRPGTSCTPRLSDSNSA